MFCSKCGAVLADNSAFCQSCGVNVGDIPEVPQSAQSPTKSTSTFKFPMTALLSITGGATMMLIALAFDWYTFSWSGADSLNKGWSELNDLTNSDLMGEYVFNYAGTILPLIFMIVFSSIILATILYSYAIGKLLHRLWAGLGFICLVLLIINYAYLYIDIGNKDFGNSVAYVAPHAGWGIAFVGAFLVILGSRRASIK